MPVTPFDEYPLQQIPSTFDHVDDSDRRWFERYWVIVGGVADAPTVVAGLGVYPNVDFMDAFVCIFPPDGEPVRVTASRALSGDRTNTSCGPITFEVVAGLRHLRVRLDDTNGSALLVDLQSDASVVERAPMPFERLPDGSVHQRSSMFAQAGRASGRVSVGGRVWNAGVGEWSFVKTNSWGIRSHRGGLDMLDAGPESAWTTPFLVADLSHGLLVLLDDDGEFVDRHGGRRRLRVVTPAELTTTNETNAGAGGRVLRMSVEDRDTNERVDVELRPCAARLVDDVAYGAYKDAAGESVISRALQPAATSFGPAATHDVGRDDGAHRRDVWGDVSAGVLGTGFGVLEAGGTWTAPED